MRQRIEFRRKLREANRYLDIFFKNYYTACMNNKTVGGIILIFVVLLLAFFVMNRGAQSPSPALDSTDRGAMEEIDSTVSDDTIMEDETAVTTFTLDGDNFSFSEKELRVKKGDTVKIVLNSKDMMHDWVVDELSVRTEIIPAGKSTSVEFVADEAGTFEYYCSVGDHRQQGMVGTLIVE